MTLEIEQFWPHQTKISDFKWLKKSLKGVTNGADAANIIADLAKGDLQAFRIKDKEAKGIVITQIIKHPNGREMSIWALGGERIFPKKVFELRDRLLEQAIKWNCKNFTAVNQHAAFDPIYAAMFGPYAATVYRQEISHEKELEWRRIADTNDRAS